jgi:hypothetical protein
LTAGRPPAAFYCMSSDVYFLGAVGLVNSLRLVGHTEPIFLLDCGLTDSQRELLAREATIVSGPEGVPPFLLKTFAPVRHPAEVTMLIDADMVVTRPLTPLISAGATGKVVAGRTGLPRFFADWGELLDLGPVRPMPYLSTALMSLGGELGREILRLVDERRDRVDFERTYFEGEASDHPLLHAEEDLVNAALAARAADEQVVAFESRLSASPPFPGLRVVDARALRCAYRDGTEPYVVHHWLAKPWLEPTHHGVYSQLLRRLLIGDDVAVRVPEDEVPLRLRRGLRALAERKRINARERFRYHVREPLAARLRGGRR